MKQLACLLGLSSILITIAPASAASPGIAYDSVMKFATGSDAASSQPGTFEADFQTASQPVQQPSGGGGFLAGMNAKIGQAMAMANIMKTGLAQRHYIAGSKERVDNVAAQTATILDCQARTLATLDLKAKTYTLVSLDAPQRPAGTGRSAPSGPQTMPTDDGTKVSMTITNQALGQRQIGPDRADGYRSDMQMTVTKADGESSTSQMNMTEYLIKFPHYAVACGGAPSSVPVPMAALMSQYTLAQRAMGLNSDRFKITTSGPAFPSGGFSLFTLFTGAGAGGASGNARGGQSGFAMILEQGHERAITSDDPAFSIPPDFTKTN